MLYKGHRVHSKTRVSKGPAPGGVHSANEHRHKHDKLAANGAG